MSSSEDRSISHSKRYQKQIPPYYDRHNDDYHHHHSHRNRGYDSGKYRSRSRSRENHKRKFEEKKYENNKDNIINYKEKLTENNQEKDAKKSNKNVDKEEEERKKRKAKAKLLALLEKEEKNNKSNLNENLDDNDPKEIVNNNQLDIDFLGEEGINLNKNNQNKSLLNEGNLQNIVKDNNILGNDIIEKDGIKENNNVSNDKREVDPLDAYMKSIENDATMQDYQVVQMNNYKSDNNNEENDINNKIITFDDIKIEDENSNSQKNEKGVIELKNSNNNNSNDLEKNKDELQEEDFHKNFLTAINQIISNDNSNNNNCNSLQNNVEQKDIIYQEDDVSEYIFDSDMLSTEDQWKKLKFNMEKGKELKQVNHSEIQYEDFNKNLYIEPLEVSKLTNEEVVKIRQENGNIRVRGKNIPKPIFNWYHCGLNSTIIQILKEREIKTPFPIQMQCIPCIMSGRDLIGIAETGSGKTLAYVLPMLRHVLVQRPIKDGDGPIALILVPTRELACQIYQEIRYFTRSLKIEVTCVFGGSSLGTQINEMKRGVEIVVATPGRFIDILCLSNGKITNLRRVTYVVLDEADRMLDLGFEPQISRIISNIRPTRQTVMFSATFPRQIENLAKKILTKPVEIVVGNRGQSAKNIEQHVEIIPKSKSFIRLLELLDIYEDISTIIFVDNQDEAIEVWKQLFKRGYQTCLLHGGMDQGDRIDSIDKFKKDEVKILISTSICARGLDIKQCGLVINFRCPNHMEDYIHRIGRTGRAGKKGIAYTFICPYEEDYLAEDILNALEINNQEVPFDLREVVRNYKKKVENGETDKHRISGYLGKGYQFTSNENMINNLERKLIGDGIIRENNIDDIDNNEHEENVKKLMKLTNGENTNVTNALVLRKNYRNLYDNEKDNNNNNTSSKLKQISHDLKAKQIAIDIGMNTAKAAILSGKKEEEILPLVQNAIKKALDNYKPGVSIQKGVQNAIKIIDDWEYKENIKNHIFTCEFEINDYPINARNKCYNKEFIKTITELNDVDIVMKGTLIEYGKKQNIGQKKLYLLIKGKNQANVNNAYIDLKSQLDDIAFSYYTNSSGFSGNVQKYNI